MAKIAAGTVQTPSPAMSALATIMEYVFSPAALARDHTYRTTDPITMLMAK
jgi:hypothetical protein